MKRKRQAFFLILILFLSLPTIKVNAPVGKLNSGIIIHTSDADVTLGTDILFSHIVVDTNRILFNTTYFGIYPSAGTVAVTLDMLDTDNMITDFSADGTDTTYNWTWTSATLPHLIELSGAITIVNLTVYEPVIRTLSFTLNGSGAVEVRVNGTAQGEPSSITYANGTVISYDYNAGTMIANFSVSLSEEEIILDWPVGEFVDIDAPDGDEVIVWGVGGNLLLSFDNEMGSIAYDSGGNNSDGTINGADRTGYGLYGRALEFDGVDDYVNVNDDISLDIASNISIAAWINTADSGGVQGIVAKNGSYALSVIPNFGIRMTINTTDIDTPPNAFDSGEWTYVVGVYNGSVIGLWIDGELHTSQALSGSIANTTSDVDVGRYLTSYFNGTIDEVRIVDYDVDQAGIVAVMWDPIETFPYNLQASITDMDCTDWVFVGDGYHFAGEYVRQNASYPITDVGLMFTDGVGWTIATFDLVNEDWDLISDGAYTMVNTNSSECNTFTMTWELYISSGMFDAINVDLWMYCLDNTTAVDGYEITEEDYFNIYNTGGSEEYESSGDGFSILGEGVFGLAATNSSLPAGSWAYANITWRKLQHMSFLVHMWQNTTWDAGSGYWNCPSEHAETASVEYGIDYWYNGSWMTGWSVVLEVIDGEAGTFGVGADQAWVLINATWYNGDVVVDWDTFYAYYEAIQSGDTTTQFALRVDLWVGIEGGSSTVAGRVRPEYFGMNESGWGPWAGWGPVSGLEDESAFYDDLLDGDGNPISAGELELFLAWANLTKTQPDAGDPDCDNHLWALLDYDGPHWRTLFVTDQMVGINTPIIPDAITPGDVSMGFFSNLITAMVEGITKPIVAALGGGATALYFFTAGIIDSAFEYFNIFNFMSSITTMITTYGTYFATSMANMILLTVQMFRIIASISGFLIEWLTRMITFVIELGTIVVNILNGTQAGVGAIYDVWALFEVSEWIDFIPVAIFITWIQAIDDRSAKMGGGTLTIIIGDLQMVSWIIGFMVDWFSRIINFVINNVMAIMNAIRIRMSI